MKMLWTQRMLGIVSLLACLSVAVIAQDQPPARPAPPATQPDGTVLRSYCVRELVSDSQDFPLIPPVPDRNNGGGGGGGIFGGQQGQPASRTYSRDERMDRVAELVKVAVANQTWKDQASRLGSISSVYPYLLVYNKPEVQKQVAEFLDQLRRDWAVEASIEIDANWLLVTAEQVASWQSGQAVNPDLLKDPKALYSCARAIGRNNQIVSIAGGQLGKEVDTVVPVVGDSSSAFQVDTTPLRIGAALEVLPRLSDDRRSLLVDLTSTITDNIPGKEVPQPTTRMGNPVDIMQAMEKPPRQNQRLAETVRLPLGTPKFVGGMTLDPGKPDGKHLCLILTAHVIDPLADKPAGADNNKGK